MVKTGKYKGKSEDEVKAEMERLRTGIEHLKAREPKSQEEVETERMKARLSELEELKANRAKEAEVEAALKKLRALKAAGKPIPEGSPSEEELEGLLKRLRSRDAELEKKLGVEHDGEVDTEIGEIRSKLKMRETQGYGEEYGSLSLDVGDKKRGKGGDDDGEKSMGLCHLTLVIRSEAKVVM